MIPFRRTSGRPDDPDSAHDRARGLLSDRLLGPLPPSDDAWLTAHLGDCHGCQAIAAGWEADRAVLRGFATALPEPPRDLWARTAAAIEVDAAAGRRRRGGARSGTPGGRRSAVPVGLLSIALVVVVVAGASLLSGPPAPGIVTASPGTRGAIAQATPLAVTASRVGWLEEGANGTYGLAFAAINRVCPANGGPACAPIGDLRPQTILLAQQPRSVVLSPRSDQLVIVPEPGAGGASSGGVLVVPLATAGPVTQTPLPETPAPVVTPSGSSSLPPIASSPRPSLSPTMQMSPLPTVPLPSPSAAGSSSAASAGPSALPASPMPTPMGSVEIARGVVVVGEAAAYTSDGQWFAFSARPVDGSAGPDIYVWKVGAASAVRETSDHRSVFAAWLGSVVLGSRVESTPVAEAPVSPSSLPGANVPSDAGPSAGPSASASPASTYQATSFLLDPASGVQADLSSPGLWQPVVDPTRRTVVYWAGTLATNDGGLSWHPSEGNLVLGAWNAPSLPSSPGPSASPRPSDGSVTPPPTPLPMPTDSGSPGPSATTGTGVVTAVLAQAPIGDFDARFDPEGSHLAIWTADPTDPTIGRLTLFAIDPSTGMLATTAPLVAAVPALRGFSLQSGRLAWATPAGQDGQGSRLQVVAWSGSSFGSVETIPGERVLVVH